MRLEGIIYKIENKVNGKVYIGQTRVGFKERIYAHRRALIKNEHNNDYLQRAWNKYGEVNFTFSIVETCSLEELDEKEVNWIKYHRSCRGAYNLESGGNKNKIPSDYSRMKMSVNTREAFKRPDVIEKIKKAALKRRGSNNHNARKVICITNSQIYDTATEASNELGVTTQDIHKVCSGIYKSAGKYTIGKPLQFKYYEPGMVYKEEKIIGLYERKPVMCVNTKEIFPSATKAAAHYKLSQSDISACCAGKRNFAGRLKNGDYMKWVLQEDYDPHKEYSFERNKGSNNPKSRRVVCLTTGEVFDTMTEAGKRHNISGNGCKISLACTGKRKHVGKLQDGTKLEWAYLDDPPKAPE